MAEALVKKKLMLEGLDCANCAMKKKVLGI